MSSDGGYHPPARRREDDSSPSEPLHNRITPHSLSSVEAAQISLFHGVEVITIAADQKDEQQRSLLLGPAVANETFCDDEGRGRSLTSLAYTRQEDIATNAMNAMKVICADRVIARTQGTETPLWWRNRVNAIAARSGLSCHDGMLSSCFNDLSCSLTLIASDDAYHERGLPVHANVSLLFILSDCPKS